MGNLDNHEVSALAWVLREIDEVLVGSWLHKNNLGFLSWMRFQGCSHSLSLSLYLSVLVLVDCLEGTSWALWYAATNIYQCFSPSPSQASRNHVNAGCAWQGIYRANITLIVGANCRDEETWLPAQGLTQHPHTTTMLAESVTWIRLTRT